MVSQQLIAWQVRDKTELLLTKLRSYLSYDDLGVGV